jgi:hypothetical protein
MSNKTTSDNATGGAIVALTDDDIITICNALGHHISDRGELDALISKLCYGRRIRAAIPNGDKVGPFGSPNWLYGILSDLGMD